MNINSTKLSSLEENDESIYIANVWNDVNYAFSLAKADKKQYYRYKDDEKIKNGEYVSELSTYQMDEIRIMSILERLGFSLDEVGTYLYKELVINVYSDIEKTGENLLEELKNPYSSYYQQIARGYYEMGVKTFHKYINSAIESIDETKVDESLVETIFGNDIVNSGYGIRAYEIAAYMVRIDKSKSHGELLEKK